MVSIGEKAIALIAIGSEPVTSIEKDLSVALEVIEYYIPRNQVSLCVL